MAATNMKTVWTAKKEDLRDINSLIDFLEWARETLKVEEGAEVRVIYHPGENAFEFQVLNGPQGPIRRVRLGTHTF